MSFYERLITNHPLANIAFAVLVLLGLLAYTTLPREQDPEINFNFVAITTALPGASAEDIERRVTNPLEDAIRNVQSIRFVTSSSRENVSVITVRFRELDERTFDKRINDLRREIQNKAASELPAEIVDPEILEITTSNGFPTAVLALVGKADDEVLRRTAYQTQQDLERLSGIDQIVPVGLNDPELQVDFDPVALANRGLTAADLADAVRGWFRDTFAGRQRVGDNEWLVRVLGQAADPDYLAGLRVRGPNGNGSLRLDTVARVERGRERGVQRVSFNGEPAILMSINKRANVNTLALLEQIKTYMSERNPVLANQGLRLELTDDQTVPTQEAIDIMESNALLGLCLVLLVCWVFLGTGISLLVSSGVVFAICGTLWTLSLIGSTLNVQVFVGLVVVLGMLVDDAIVIVEDIYYRIERGAAPLKAAREALGSVLLPVSASVATTIAAFLPLVLLPGILGQFLSVIPTVVVLGLTISLIEAVWILPAHVVALGAKPAMKHPRSTWRKILAAPGEWTQRQRRRFTHALRVKYTRSLTFAMRHAWFPAGLLVLLVGGAFSMIQSGRVPVEFFAFDPLRIFYVNLDLPPETALDETLRETEAVRRALDAYLEPGDARAITVQAGLKFTETEPLYGDQYGQITVSLNPRRGEMRSSLEIVEAMRGKVEAASTRATVTFLPLSGGPPNTKPVNVKVRAEDFGALRRAADAVLAIVRNIPGAQDIGDDDVRGRPQLVLRLDREAVENAGLDPALVARLIQLHVDGEIISDIRDAGEKVEVRVRAAPRALPDIVQLLDDPVALPDGRWMRLGALVSSEKTTGKGVIRHYKLRRAITVEADLAPGTTNTLAAVEIVQREWAKIRAEHPNADLDFSGEFEDIQESLGAMGALFLLGIGLIYLILATQFRSYWQPFLVLITVPFAFCGAVLGLAVGGFPLSLYTLYGAIALGGVAVNSAIVLMNAANDRLMNGMSLLHATVYAARRRVVPIIMTTGTTIAGLFTLAFGIGGKSLLWGPVAASLFWGLLVSTVMTLYVVPYLYRIFMRRSPLARASAHRRALGMVSNPAL
jgi:multidrug efflux pump subunit AcrB